MSDVPAALRAEVVLRAGKCGSGTMNTNRSQSKEEMTRTVEELDLDFHNFRCCGDEDLYPFGCPDCGRPMVFCYECDTLYGDLKSLENKVFQINHSDPAKPIFACPECGHEFEYWFIRDGRHKISFERWVEAGFGHILKDREQG